MNVNVATNSLHVIYMFYIGNVPVNAARKFSWERSIPASVILYCRLVMVLCVCVCVCDLRLAQRCT